MSTVRNGAKVCVQSDPDPFSLQMMQTGSTGIPLRHSGNANWQKESSSRLIAERVGQVNESQQWKSQQWKSQQMMIALSPHQNLVFP